MILFAADNHYDQHCGYVLYRQLRSDYPIEFHEDDWACLEQNLVGNCDLLILNMIADTCGIPPPGAAAESRVRAYVEAGKPVFLLHGASAAFWHWDWWRPLVGHRWVRPGGRDPDGSVGSSHPERPYTVRVSKARHPLVRQLQDVEMPKDEIYMHLEQTSPTLVLLETTTNEGTFPMCYEGITPFGGRILAYIPGHRPEVVAHAGNVANCRRIIDYLQGPGMAPPGPCFVEDFADTK